MHADEDDLSGAIIGSALSVPGTERVAGCRQPIRPIRVHLRASACICVRPSFLRPCTWHAQWGPGATDPAAPPSHRLAPCVAISCITKRDAGETQAAIVSHYASRSRTERNETSARRRPLLSHATVIVSDTTKRDASETCARHRLTRRAHPQTARNETSTRHAPPSSHSIPTPSTPTKRDVDETQPNTVSPYARTLDPHETRRQRDTAQLRLTPCAHPQPPRNETPTRQSPPARSARGPAAIPTRIARPHLGHGRTMTTLRAPKPPCRGHRRTGRPDSGHKVSALPRPARSDRCVRPARSAGPCARVRHDGPRSKVTRQAPAALPPHGPAIA
jgi:hypothetical protein